MYLKSQKYGINGMEEYKKQILLLIENSNDMEYVIAVYSFADSYPDKSSNESV